LNSIRWIRSAENTGRFIHYESRASEGDPSPSHFDIIANMYVSSDRMVELSEIDPTKPVILCEVNFFFFFLSLLFFKKKIK